VLNLGIVAPGIFASTVAGKSAFAGQVTYVHADGSQSVVESTMTNNNALTYNPIDLSTPGDHVYLVFFGSGFRHGSSLTASANGFNIPTLFFGAQTAYPGLDQINLGRLSAGLAGAGVATILVSVDGQAANAVTAAIR
jgi:uncharacterized protein (TIGR03437 family)